MGEREGDLIKFYVVVYNNSERSWRDAIMDGHTYDSHRAAQSQAKAARRIYGWAKVIKCEVRP